MTRHTDAERALFEAVASDDGKWPKAIERDAKGNYLLLTTANGWMWWQSARRAPSMPDQSIIEAVDGWFARNTALGGCSDKDVAELAAIFAAAPQPPAAEENPLQDQLDEALQSLEFYKRRCDLLQSIQPRMRDPERTMVCDVLANGHLLQSGDGQPDKARYAPPEAAPVQLPEPAAWRYTDARGHYRYRGMRHGFAAEYPLLKPVALYTEQQVRELLAAHGIKVNQ